MKVLITGGTGFVGKQLTEYLLNSGYEVTCVGRSPQMEINHDKFHYISADTTQTGSWQKTLNEMDAVVNLAGASIFNRWSNDHKKLMYDSRVLTTKNLVDGLPDQNNVVLISTSAVGYYGDRKDDILMEKEPPGKDFLAMLGKDWEQEAIRAREKGSRVAVTRFSIVLGKNGGALKMMLPLFKWFLGGPLGTGKQWFPWIHMNDLISAVKFILENENVNGVLNFTSPIPIRQRDFARALGRQLNRPAVLPAPSFMIRLMMGELGAALLSSQKVIPDQLIKHGFKFQFMEIDPALENILHNH